MRVTELERPRLAAAHPEWPLKRIVLAAQRTTVKRFLADLWLEWRRRAGLDIVAPYSLHSSRVLMSTAAPHEASLGVRVSA